MKELIEWIISCFMPSNKEPYSKVLERNKDCLDNICEHIKNASDYDTLQTKTPPKRKVVRWDPYNNLDTTFRDVDARYRKDFENHIVDESWRPRFDQLEDLQSHLLTQNETQRNEEKNLRLLKAKLLISEKYPDLKYEHCWTFHQPLNDEDFEVTKKRRNTRRRRSKKNIDTID